MYSSTPSTWCIQLTRAYHASPFQFQDKRPMQLHHHPDGAMRLASHDPNVWLPLRTIACRRLESRVEMGLTQQTISLCSLSQTK